MARRHRFKKRGHHYNVAWILHKRQANHRQARHEGQRRYEEPAAAASGDEDTYEGVSDKSPQGEEEEGDEGGIHRVFTFRKRRVLFDVAVWVERGGRWRAGGGGEGENKI